MKTFALLLAMIPVMVLIATLFATPTASAAPESLYTQTFAQANAAYAAEAYEEAVRGYEQLIGAAIEDPAVFYNLGNAYYRLGEFGKSIGNYERALQRDSTFEDARNNLALAVARAPGKRPRPAPAAWEETLLFWHFGIGLDTARTAAIVCWLGFWGLLAARQWRRFRFGRRGAAVLGACAVAFAFSAYAKAQPPRLAVASVDEVPVRYGTSADHAVRLTLREGDRVRVEEAADGWLRVETADGQQGWAQDAQLLRIGPPYELPTLEDGPGDGIEESPRDDAVEDVGR